MRWRLSVFLALGLLWPAAAAQAPAGVHLAWGADPMTSVTVAWTGGPAPQGARVEYGPSTSFGASVAAARTAVPGSQLFAYRATLTGLQAEARYHYRIVQDEGASATFSFATAPGNPSRPVRLAAWGDHGVPDPSNPLGEADGDAPHRSVELARTLNATTHLVAGDLSYANGYPPTWDRYFEMLEPYVATVPFMSAVGNHEREAAQGFLQYDARLPMPSPPGERYYAFRVGSVFVVSLDTEHACATTPADDLVSGSLPAACRGEANLAQLSFLDAVLRQGRRDSNVAWVVVFHHYPLWSDGPHGSNLDVRKLWAPLYDRYRVDVVVQAHDHLYERSKPIRNGSVAPAGTTYMTVGTGGASHYDFSSSAPPEWEAARNNEDYGVLVLTATPDRLDGEFVAHDGNARDRWALVRGPDGNAQPAPTDPPAAEPPPGSAGTPGPSLLLVTLALWLGLGRRRPRRPGDPVTNG